MAARSRVAPCGLTSSIWTWTAICADTKLQVQLTSDGHRAYLDAVEGAFGGDVDYAMLMKLYGGVQGKDSGTRYSPAQCTGIRWSVISGDPAPRSSSRPACHADRT